MQDYRLPEAILTAENEIVELRILGAHGNEAKGARLTSFLVDGILAIDAGGLTSALSLVEQERVKAVLLTHHHFDHTRDLVTLGYNAALWSGQIRVYALPETLNVVIPCLLDGKIYANLLEYPSKKDPLFSSRPSNPIRKKILKDTRFWRCQ